MADKFLMRCGLLVCGVLLLPRCLPMRNQGC